MDSLPADGAPVNNTPDVLVFRPEEAVTFGLHEAIILNQVRYWLKRPTSIQQEREWVYSSYSQWQCQFPFMSERTLRRSIKSLEEQGGLIADNQKTPAGIVCKHYKLGPAARMANLDTGGGQLGMANLTTAHGQNGHMQYKDSETSLELTPILPANPRLKPAVDWSAKLLELEGKLPDSCKTHWEVLKEARAKENKTGAVSASVLATLLEEILSLGLDAAPLAHGMSKGVPNKTYIARVASGYRADLPPLRSRPEVDWREAHGEYYGPEDEQ